jgi:hypothetical protein
MPESVYLLAEIATITTIAKDLARLTADAIDAKPINEITKGNVGPLKALEAPLCDEDVVVRGTSTRQTV